MDHDERPFGWGLCSRCGEDCEDADYNPRTRTSLCRDCDNYEPGDADGEDFRGGEAAAFEREQMAHIQRTLK